MIRLGVRCAGRGFQCAPVVPRRVELTFQCERALLPSSLQTAEHSAPIPLDPEAEFATLVLCAFLGRSAAAHRLDGPARHAILRKLLSSMPGTETELREWMLARFGKSFTGQSWDLCRSLANRWRIDGIKAADAGVLEDSEDVPCPSVLLYKGNLSRRLPRLAVFNSRKPLAILPDAGWIKALRSFLRDVRHENIAYASSGGTLTYELVAAHASRASLPLLMAAPFSILEPSPPGSEHYRKACGTFSCLLSNNLCPKAQKLVCRDRILAAASQVHLVLELREGGNICTILEERQKKSPRIQFVLDPGKKTSSNAGNYTLLQKFPGYSKKYNPPAPVVPALGNLPVSRRSAIQGCSGDRVPEKIQWHKFLYHYTRGCPGPWPGQSRAEYLFTLIDADPLSGHSALDTLIRIVTERRIRADSKMVRGIEPVVSWTSIPPNGIGSIRRWNRALIRWTVEPCGIAVSRKFLRTLGAKPAAYARDSGYVLLPEHEKFRFQVKSSAGAIAWAAEREWRLKGDLEIALIGDGDWFVFVSGEKEKERVIDSAGPGIPIKTFDLDPDP